MPMDQNRQHPEEEQPISGRFARSLGLEVQFPGFHQVCESELVHPEVEDEQRAIKAGLQEPGRSLIQNRKE